MSVNHESMPTHDEFSFARQLAQERYFAMLSEVDYSEIDPEDKVVEKREGWLAFMAWRQAMAFVLMGRDAAEGNIQG